jgi:prevent-host-death family protein
MERFVGIEEARAKLGQLAEEVSGGAEPIVLAKKGRALAVLLGRDEYSRFKEAASRRVREDLASRLTEVRRRIVEAGLEPRAVDEAISAVRELG